VTDNTFDFRAFLEALPGSFLVFLPDPVFRGCDKNKCGRVLQDTFLQKNLRSVLYNLLSNGIKYRSSHRAPKLEVSCQKVPNFHVLTIFDNGLGLKENQLSRLFSMFKRFHDHVEGTGIGLYMVKKMVENVGGHIEVESKVGIGTTFSIYFPE
jgi:signal transduction histidine kinase